MTNDLIIAKKALAQDLGIAYLPYFVVKDLIKNNLVKVLLKDFVKKERELHILYLKNDYIPVNIRLFLDFIKQEIRL